MCGAEEVGVPDVEQPHQERHVGVELGGAEVLVHGVEARPGAPRTAPARSRSPARCRSRSPASSGRRPSPRTRRRCRGRCRTRRPCRGRWRPRRSAAPPRRRRRCPSGSPSSSQALHSRALVSVSRVPKVLLDTMNSVVSGSSPASFCAASVGSMLLMKRQVEPVLDVRRQRLVGHHRTEVGAADADVDHRRDPSTGHAGPRRRTAPARRSRRPAPAPRARRRRRPARRPSARRRPAGAGPCGAPPGPR